jgi:hypothetical protein
MSDSTLSFSPGLVVVEALRRNFILSLLTAVTDAEP